MQWHALPPELNTALLMAGAGPAPMLQAAAGWSALASAFEGQAVTLAQLRATLRASWTGSASDRAFDAIGPSIDWLQTAAQISQRRALQATAQAESYTKALASTPSLAEIAGNHITHAVLSATNFLGINLVPIGLNETDYFVRMWNQAGTAMDVYQAETLANTTFEALSPLTPIVAAGAGDVPDAAAPMVAAATARKATAARRVSTGDAGPSDPDGGAHTQESPAVAQPEASDSARAQEISAVAQLVAPAPQLMQQVMQQFQQLVSLASNGRGAGLGLGGGEYASSRLGELGKEADLGPLGLVGADPLSSHPMAGGSGPRVGKGLMYSAPLTGAGVAPSGEKAADALGGRNSAGMGAGAGTSAVGGAAPMGAASGAGAQRDAGNRPGLAAPMPPALDEEPAPQEFDDDDW